MATYFRVTKRHDGPENQRQHAENAFRLHRDGVVPSEGFLEGVKWAGANIAENDPDGSDDQRRRAAFFMRGHRASPLWLLLLTHRLPV
jgi:hypothetical protein